MYVYTHTHTHTQTAKSKLMMCLFYWLGNHYSDPSQKSDLADHFILFIPCLFL